MLNLPKKIQNVILKILRHDVKILKNAIKNVMQVGLAFGTLLERILVDLMAKLGGKLEASWPILAVLSCLILSYLILSRVGPVVLSCLGYLGYLGLDAGAEWGDLGPTRLLREYPQEAPGAAQEAPRHPPRPIFGAILDDFS